MSALVLGLGAVGLGGLYYILKRSSDGIPTSKSWPLIGCYFQKAGRPFEEFLRQDFPNDPLVKLKVGEADVYFLNSKEAADEALVTKGDLFLARPNQQETMRYLDLDGGLVNSSGEVWREYRRFTLRTLRDFGFGRRGAEDIISLELDCLLQDIDSRGSEGIDTGELLGSSIANVICQLVFGSRVAAEEPKFDELLKSIQVITQNQQSYGANAVFYSTNTTWVKHLSRIMLFVTLRMDFFKKSLQSFYGMMDFCKEQIDTHEKEFQEDADARDYLEMHIKQLKNLGKDNAIFSNKRLILAVIDLFIAGTDTTTNTLRWGILYMIQNPAVLDKVFAEINSEVGQERLPTTADKVNLNYTMATLEEIQRLASLVPTGVHHSNTEKVEIAGHRIPKDSIVFTNIYHIHRNPKKFPEPDRFNPERFLDGEGRFVPHEDVMSFGIGKRACLGESLARMELFLFFATIMQKFTFSLDSKESLERLLTTPSTGLNAVRAPVPHKVIFKRR